MKYSKASELFDLSHTLSAPLLESVDLPHEALPKIKDFIISLEGKLGDGFHQISDGVYAAESASIADSARIEPPAIIGRGAVIRHCALLRGAVIIGDGAVVGNSTEIKNSIVFDGVQIPHYNYVGDSILGYMSHMGAGAVASNFRLDKRNIRIYYSDKPTETGLRKLGVMLGDFAEVGASSVLCPGTVIGRMSLIYPLSCVRGFVDEGVIWENGKTTKRK